MKYSALLELDQKIGQMEKDLSAIHQKRVKLLEEILAGAMRAEKSLPSQSPSKSVSQGIQRTTVPKKMVGAAGSKARPKKKTAKKKTVRLTSEVVIQRLQNAVKAGGADGLTAIEISKAAGVKYRTTLRNLKKMNELFSQSGEGNAARYSLAK